MLQGLAKAELAAENRQGLVKALGLGRSLLPAPFGYSLRHHVDLMCAVILAAGNDYSVWEQGGGSNLPASFPEVALLEVRRLMSSNNSIWKPGFQRKPHLAEKPTQFSIGKPSTYHIPDHYTADGCSAEAGSTAFNYNRLLKVKEEYRECAMLNYLVSMLSACLCTNRPDVAIV
ncbi:hypothetical protein C8R45DRAFT_942617 [Mycena sanguinolenta]|nr:hypothetical protein C8R45DRAFT_942617 [Mycena sanguinolenta]